MGDPGGASAEARSHGRCLEAPLARRITCSEIEHRGLFIRALSVVRRTSQADDVGDGVQQSSGLGWLGAAQRRRIEDAPLVQDNMKVRLQELEAASDDSNERLLGRCQGTASDVIE